jgi:tetratricopeptide (TPR) repeat protein
MGDEVRRLEALRYDDGSGVSAPSVAAAFELSYRQLDKDAARLFRLLPTDPGPDVSTAAAAALAGWPPGRTRAVLGRLTRAHLVDVGSGGASRWRMHDLLRLYARQLFGPDTGERDHAADQLLIYYLKRTDAADTHLRALKGTPVPTDFANRADALEWLDEERPNLVAAVAMAAAIGQDQIAINLPLALSQYLDRRRRFDDLLTALAISLHCARRQADLTNEAAVLTSFGLALAEVRRFEEAMDALQNAVAIFRETGDQAHQEMALGNLGLALAEVGRFEEAVSAHQEGLAICRETGYRRGEGMALGNLGLALAGVGRFEEAVSAHQECLAICQETGDVYGEGIAQDSLGLALVEVGRSQEAVSAHQNGAAIIREVGDRHREGMALNNLGITLQRVGLFEEAVSAHQAAVAIFREASDRHREGLALNNLGQALREARRFEEAIDALQAAAAIFRETGEEARR